MADKVTKGETVHYFAKLEKLILTLHPSVMLYFVVFLLSACSTPVSRDSRDTSGEYDGNWTATIQKARTPQKFDNWVFSCRDLSGTVPMTVSDGEVTIRLGERKLIAYLSKDGTFKMKVNAGRTSASVSSDLPMSNPNVRLVVSGKLEKEPATGSFLVAYAQVGYNGCKSKMTFARNNKAI